MTTTVSVVMSVYNGERFLRESIASVLQQTFEDWELIVMDDGSTDSTPRILAEYQDARIRVIRNDANRKQAVCSNHGIAVASGRYIARLDADDISLPTRLAEQVAYLDRHIDVTMIGSAAHLIDEAGRRIDFREGDLNGCTLNFLFTRYCPVTHSSILVRTEFVRPPNGYDEDPQYAVTEDHEFMARVAFTGRARVLTEPLIEYRIHPSSVSARNLKDQISHMDVIGRASARRATGLDIDDRCWQAWKRFESSKPDARVPFESDEVKLLSMLIPRFLRGFKHDPEGRCVMPWHWAKHALALAVRPRNDISVVARARFLFLSLKIAVAKVIWH